jgi:hypothetical protein
VTITTQDTTTRPAPAPARLNCRDLDLLKRRLDNLKRGTATQGGATVRQAAAIDEGEKAEDDYATLKRHLTRFGTVVRIYTLGGVLSSGSRVGLGASGVIWFGRNLAKTTQA